MSEGSHQGKQWLWLLIGGLVLIAIATFFVHSHGWLLAILLGVGGLVVVFASSEMMIKAVDGYAKRKKMNSFVAGTMAGLSSNIPELVMLGFVLMATPRVGFIVTVLTLHVGATAFGLYCGTLPRDIEGNASLPKPLVKLSTDLYTAAAGVFFSLGVIMLLMKAFSVNGTSNNFLNTTDLYVFGAILLTIQVVAIMRLVKRFSVEHTPESEDDVPLETALILWKAVQDDGKVNWLETSSMVAIFVLVIYLLVAHG